MRFHEALFSADRFIQPLFKLIWTAFCVKIRDVQHKYEFINVDKLMRREPILFFQNLILFEDELSDNGCAQLSVKLRAMKSCFLLLLRFYLRVDDVMVRVIDSRFYTEPTWKVIIWEFTKREDAVSELRAKVRLFNSRPQRSYFIIALLFLRLGGVMLINCS